MLNAVLKSDCKDTRKHRTQCPRVVVSRHAKGCAYFNGARHTYMRVVNDFESMKLTRRGWTISWRMKPAKRSYFPIIEYQKSASYWGVHIWHYGEFT